MLENEEKGSYGAFSSAGKNSVELFTNIRKKDAILNPQNNAENKLSIINFLKRNGYHNIHGDDTEIKHHLMDELDESQLEEVEEEIDIFKMEAKKNLNKNQNIKRKIKFNENEPHYFHRLNKEYYKFHDLRRQKGIIVKPDTTPTCTKYLPSKKLVWRKTINWPGWETMKARPKLFMEKDGKFYINHGDILTQVGPCFIQMEKQTMRGNCVPATHYLRVITTKPFMSKHFKHRNNNLYMKKNKKKNLEIDIENDFFTFGIAEQKENMFNNRYNSNENLNKKWMPKKREFSAMTSSTRPQTGRPTSFKKFGSRPMTSTQSGNFTGTKNATGNTNNTNKSHITSKSVSKEEEKNANMDEDYISENSSELNDSYHKFENVYQRQIKKRDKNNKKKYLNEPKNQNIYTFNTKNKDIKIKITETNSSVSKSQKTQNNKKSQRSNFRPNSMYQTRYMIHKKNIKAPDFNKIISREYYSNLADNGSSLIPFSLPNFKLVRERPLTMVTYERPKYKKRKINYLQGIEPSMYNDHYKYIEYINNHMRCVPPNFDKMLARPKDDGSPLPVYMKGCVSREACNIMTERSLKMNNFSEGKFRNNYTSFWPKTSFNKIVNLNILNSNTFLNNLVGGEKYTKLLGNNVQKSIRFYNRNFKELMREGMLSKFDNITFKTIKSSNKIESRELEKFLKNYEIDKKKDLDGDIEKKLLKY